MPRLQLPAINISIENEEYAIAIQDYVASRIEIQEITSRVGQTFVLIGIVPLALSAVATRENPALTLLSAVALPLIVHIAMFIILWLSFRQVLLVGHVKSLTEYFKSVFDHEKHHTKLLYRYDMDSPLIQVFSLGKGGEPAYMVLAVVASALVISLLGMVAKVSFDIISQYDCMWAVIYLIVQILLIVSICTIWIIILVPFNRSIDRKISKYLIRR